MESINRCEACLGKKKMMGLGSMMKDCMVCRGVGYIKAALCKTEIVVKRKRRTPAEMLADKEE